MAAAHRVPNGAWTGTSPAESIAGKYFPSLNGGRMVLITDGGNQGPQLHAYISKTPGDMTNFVPQSGTGVGGSMHPPFADKPGTLSRSVNPSGTIAI